MANPPQNRRKGVDASIVQADTVRGYDSPLAVDPACDLILSTGKNAVTLDVSNIVVWNRTDATHPVMVLASGSDLNTARLVEVHTGDISDPDGTVTAPIASLYISYTSAALFQNVDGGTTWKQISDELGGESLAETLAIGNETGGLDILVNPTDAIRGYPSAVTDASDLLLTGGNATAGAGEGGDVLVQGGSSFAGRTGDIRGTTLNPVSGQNSGSISFTTGDAIGGSSGGLTLRAGQAGNANIVGNGGSVTLYGGETITTGATPARGGSFSVFAGKAQPDGEGGSVRIWAGDSAVAAVTPVVLPPTAGLGGTVNIKSGSSSGTLGGAWVNLFAGNGGPGGGVGGNIQLRPGSGGGGADDGEIIGDGIFRADNYKRGDGDPNVLGESGTEGSVFQRLSTGLGQLWVNTNGSSTGWERLAFASDFISVFTKIQSGQITPVLDQTVAGFENVFSDNGIFDGVDVYTNFVAGFPPAVTLDSDQYGPVALLAPNGNGNGIGMEVAANPSGLQVSQRFFASFKISNTYNGSAWRGAIGLSTAGANNALLSDSPGGQHIFLQKANGANTWRIFTSGAGGPNPVALNAAAGNITSSLNVPRYLVIDATVTDQLTITILDEDYESLDQVVVTDPTLFPSAASLLYPVVASLQTGINAPRLRFWSANVVTEADKLFEAAGAEKPDPTLAQVLLAGNESGPTPIILSENSAIVGETDGGVGQGSDVNITSGGTFIAANATGNLTLSTANTGTLNATGNTGDAILISGEQLAINASGDSGRTTVSTGAVNPSGTGSSGPTYIQTGDHQGTGGQTGNILVETGSHTGTGGVQGSITLRCGLGVATDAVPGDILLQGGLTSQNGVAGGDITLLTGSSGSIGNTGDITLQTPNVQLEGNSGAIALLTGNGGTNDGQGGSISMATGDGLGAGANARGGNISIAAGDGTEQGGFVTINAGDSQILDGASVTINAGDHLGGGQGGNITLNPGTGGTDGAVIINGKLTVTGLIDPTGLVLEGVAAQPYAPAVGEGVLWVDFTDSDKLKYSNSGGTIDLGSGGATALGDLTDVSLGAPVVGEVLTFNGVDWVNLAGGGGAPLSTVLALGNATGVNDIEVNTGQAVRGQTDLNLNQGPNPADAVVISGLRYPTSDGAPGDVITTDGLGNLTFAPGGGGGSGDFAEVFAQMQWGFLSPPPDNVGPYDLNGSGILHDTSDQSPGASIRAVDSDGLYHQGQCLVAAAETGYITKTEPTRRDAQFFYLTKIRASQTADIRVYFGLTTGSRVDTAFSDGPVTAAGGYLGVGFSTALGENTYHFIHNSGPGAGTRVDSGIAVDTLTHYMAIDARTPGQVDMTLYDAGFNVQATTTILANIPAPTTSMNVVGVLLSVAGANETLSTYFVSLINRADLLGGIGGGGTQTLAQVLALGNESGGTPILGDTNALGTGGTLQLEGGSSTGGGGDGGELRLYSGSPDPLANAQSGDIRLISPQGSGTGKAGDLLLLAGAGGAAGGEGGTLQFTAGDGQGIGNGGGLLLRTGSGGVGGGLPGGFSLIVGAALGGNIAGGAGTLVAGAGFGTGDGGSWTLTAGAGGLAGGDGGDIVLTPGLGNGGGADGETIVNGALVVNGKLTVTGIIDPPGLLMSSSVSAPFLPVGSEGGIWVNPSGELIFTNTLGDLNLSTAIGGGLGFLDGFLIAGYGFLSPGNGVTNPTSDGIYGGSAFTTQTFGATILYDTDVEGPFVNLSTAASPTSESRLGTTDKIIRRDQRFKAVFKYQVTSPVHTDERIFIGFTNDETTQLSVDDPGANQYIGLRQDLAGINLEFVARGSGGAMVPVFAAPTDTSVRYFSVDFSDPAGVTFRLLSDDGQTIITEHTEPASNLIPDTTENLQAFVGVRTDAGAVRDLDFYFSSIVSRADIVDAVTGGGGGGGTSNLAAVLLVGNESGGTPIKGSNALTGGDLELYGGDSTGGGGDGGAVLIEGGTPDGAGTSGAVTITTKPGDTAGAISIVNGVSNVTAGSNLILTAGATAAAGQAGGAVGLLGGDSTTGASGTVLVQSGTSTSGDSGDVLVRCPAAGTNGNGGSVNIDSGDGDGTGDGGNLRVMAGAAGAASTINGGVEVNAGGGMPLVPVRGNVLLTSSPDTNADSAHLQVEPATPTDGGSISLFAGSGLAGNANGGNLTLEAGAPDGVGDFGSVILIGNGVTPPALTGSIFAEARAEAGGGLGGRLWLNEGQTAVGGDASLVAGAGNAGAADGGALTLSAGAGDGAGQGGDVVINSGASTLGDAGQISILGGDTANIGQDGGALLLAGGGGVSTSLGGNVTIRGGNIGSAPGFPVFPVNGQGGYLRLLGGASDGSASGGPVYILGGQSGPSAPAGGGVVITGGGGRTGSNATGGAVSVTGGQGGSAGAPGGDVTIQGGAAGGVGLINGGSIYLVPGVGGNPATPGEIRFEGRIARNANGMKWGTYTVPAPGTLFTITFSGVFPSVPRTVLITVETPTPVFGREVTVVAGSRTTGQFQVQSTSNLGAGDLIHWEVKL